MFSKKKIFNQKINKSSNLSLKKKIKTPAPDKWNSFSKIKFSSELVFSPSKRTTFSYRNAMQVQASICI